jgi:hypothetical protein
MPSFGLKVIRKMNWVSFLHLLIISIVPLTALTWAAFRKDVGHTAWMKNPR